MDINVEVAQAWLSYISVSCSSGVADRGQKKVVELNKFLRVLVQFLPESPDQLSQVLDVKEVCNFLARELCDDLETVNVTSELNRATCHPSAYFIEYLQQRGAAILIALAILRCQGLTNGSNIAQLLIMLLRKCLLHESQSSSQHFSLNTTADTVADTCRLAPLEIFVVESRQIAAQHNQQQFANLSSTRQFVSDQISPNQESDEFFNDPLYPQLAQPVQSRLRDDKYRRRKDSDSSSNNVKIFKKVRVRPIVPSMLDLVDCFLTLPLFSSSNARTFTSETSNFVFGVHEICILVTSVLKDIIVMDDKRAEEQQEFEASAAKQMVVSNEIIHPMTDLLIDLVRDLSKNVIPDESEIMIFTGRLLLRILLFCMTGQLADTTFHTPETHSPFIDFVSIFWEKLGSQLNTTSKQSYLLTFACDAVYACWLYLDAVLGGRDHKGRHLDQAAQFTVDTTLLDLLRLVIRSKCLEFLQVIILRLDTTTSTGKSTTSGLLRLIGSTVTRLKLLRTGYVHMVACSHVKHVSCVRNFTHVHHHDVMGAAYKDTMSNGLKSSLKHQDSNANASPSFIQTLQYCSSTCLIATLSSLLLNIYSSSDSVFCRIKVLTTISRAGCCCCLMPGEFLQTMLVGFHKQAVPVKKYIFRVVNAALLVEFGGRKLSSADVIPALPCDSCTDCNTLPQKTAIVSNSYLMQHVYEITSCTKECTCTRNDSVRSSPMDKTELINGMVSNNHLLLNQSESRWVCACRFLLLLRGRCWKAYRESATHISLDSVNVVNGTSTCDHDMCDISNDDARSNALVMSSLLHLADNGSPELKYNLLRTIVLPVLLHYAKCYTLANEKVTTSSTPSTIVLSLCLQVLSSTLDVALARQLFLAADGLHLLTFFILEVTAVIPSTVNVFRSVIRCQTVGVDDRDVITKSMEEKLVLQSLCDILFADYDKNQVNGMNYVDSYAIRCLEHSARRTSQVWLAASVLIDSSNSFREEFLNQSGPACARALLSATVRQFLTKSAIDVVTVEQRLAVLHGVGMLEGDGCLEADLITIIHATLTICMQFCHVRSIVPDCIDSQTWSLDELLAEIASLIHEIISDYSVHHGSLQLFCEMLLLSARPRRSFDDCKETTNNDDICTVTSNEETDNERNLLQRTINEAFITAESEIHKEPLSDGDYEEVQSISVNTKDSSSSSSSPATMRNIVKPRANAKLAESSSLSFSTRPELLRLALVIGAAYYERHQIDSAAVVVTLSQLAQFVQQYPTVINSVHFHDFMKILLRSFRSCIALSNADCCKEVRAAVLNLFLVIARRRLLSADLKTFLALFNEKSICTAELLLILRRLTSSIRLEPIYFVRFPVVSSCGVSQNNNTLPDTAAVDFVSACWTSVCPSPAPPSTEQRMTGREVGSRVTSLRASFSVALWIMIDGAGRGKQMKKKLTSSQKLYRHRSTEMEASPNDSVSSILQDSNKTFSPTIRNCGTVNTRRSWSDACVHLISIGNQQLAVEMWLHDKAAGLVIRIVSRLCDRLEVIAQTYIPQLFKPEHWHHLTLSYSEKSESNNSRLAHCTIVTTLDGLNQRTTMMQYVTSLDLSKLAQTCFHVGHLVSTGKPNSNKNRMFCQLGNILLFKDFPLTLEMSTFLLSLGPDLCTMQTCDSSEQLSVYTSNIIKQMATDSQLLHALKLPIEHKLRIAHLLTFNARYPDMFNFEMSSPDKSSNKRLSDSITAVDGNISPAVNGAASGSQTSITPTVQVRSINSSNVNGNDGRNNLLRQSSSSNMTPSHLTTKDGGTMSSGGKRSSGGGQESFGSNLINEKSPVNVREQSSYGDVDHVESMMDGPTMTQQATLKSSIHQVGGIGVFLFLFAKVVEQKQCENDQASALNLLFSLIRRDTRLFRQFNDMNGYAMITKVCLSVRCIVGYKMLKVLLDASVTESVIHTPKKDENRADDNIEQHKIVVNPSNSSVIFDVRVITDTLLEWTIWNKSPDVLWLVTFEAINSLIDPGHPYVDYNVQQLQSAGVVSQLLNICLERVQQSCPSLTPSVCEQLILLITRLIGQPPDVHNVVHICDFLLLSHPAASTFIVHHPSLFCFRNKWIESSAGWKNKKRILHDQVPAQLPSSTSWSNSLSANGIDIKRKNGKTVNEPSEKSDQYDSSADYKNRNNNRKDRNSDTEPSGFAVEICELKSNRFDNSVTKTNGSGTKNYNVTNGLKNGNDKNWLDSVNVVEMATSDSVNSNSVVGDNALIDTKEMNGAMKSYDNSSRNSTDTCRKSNQTESVLRRNGGSEMEQPRTGLDADASNVLTVVYNNESCDEQDNSNRISNGNGVCDFNSSPSVSSSDDDDTAGSEEGSVNDTVDDEMADHQVSEDNISLIVQNAIEQDDEGLITIVVGLLEHLVELLPVIPRDDLQKVFIVLKPHMLIVMAHHGAIRIRKAVVKMLQSYLLHASHKLVEAFYQISGYYLLANQLNQHDVDRELVDLCLSLVGPLRTTNEQFASYPNLLENNIIDVSNTVDAQQITSVVVVMSLLENIVSNCVVCSTALAAVELLFTSSAAASQFMLQSGLTQMLCNVVHQFNQLDSISILESDRRQLTNAIQSLLVCIALKTFCFTGNVYYQHCEETICLLQCLESKETVLHGKISKESMFVLSLEYLFVQAIFFVFIEDEIATDTAGTGSSHYTGGQSCSIADERLRGLVFGSKDTSQAELKLTAKELSERWKKIIVDAVDLVIFHGLERSEEDESVFIHCVNDLPDVSTYVRYITEFLVKSLVTGLAKKGSSGRRTKLSMSSILWQTKDALKVQVVRLVVRLLSPSTKSLSDRLHVVRLLVQQSSTCIDMLQLIVQVDDAGVKISHYLYEIVTNNVDALSRDERADINELIDLLQLCQIQPLRVGTKRSQAEKADIDKEINLWKTSESQERTKWLRKQAVARQRVLHKLDSLSKSVTGHAWEVTQLVTAAQSQLRKKLVDHIKQKMSNRLQVKKAWQQTILQLSHERAIWYDAKCYPASWQLDPTEGPSRMRCRLQRCHLNIDKRFFLPEHQDKLAARQFEPPLCYLFDDDKLSLDSAALIYKLHTSETIRYTCVCSMVTPDSATASPNTVSVSVQSGRSGVQSVVMQSSTSGDLLIGQADIFYVADKVVKENINVQALLGNCDELFMTLPHNDITEFHKQWYLLQDTALEIFLSSGKTCLLAFNSTEERDKFYTELQSLDLSNVVPSRSLMSVQQQWLEGRMTNFDYLMELNKRAGRSFNDLMQYPIYPFVLSQYDKNQLDLTNPVNFRILSKTISTQIKAQELKYIQLYENLSQQKLMLQSCGDEVSLMNEPFHYTNYCSNIATLLQYLVRLPPFTSMFIKFQDNNFDCADRSFHDLQTTYRLAIIDSLADTKELIPEFFFLPEFLENKEGYNLGVKQNGTRVNDVVLPPWCQNDARLFTLIHRQALESDFVRQSLHGWIDLVFGFKQKGKEAFDAINVYHPSIYFGVNVEAINDDLLQKAIKAMIRTYGQAPKQLFKIPHAVPPLSLGLLNISAKKNNDPIVLPGVTGLRWGEYVGSPDQPTPFIVYREQNSAAVSNLVILPTGEVFGLNSSSTLLLKRTGGKRSSLLTQTGDICWAAVISWNAKDGIVRIRNSKKDAPVNFLHWNPIEQITSCASVADCSRIFFASDAGVITVLNTTFNSTKQCHVQIFDRRLKLFGHTGAIPRLVVCKAFSILVSASVDTTCIIWDLNRLCYVRSITDHVNGVIELAVSDTSGDIASVSYNDAGSHLMLHTVNARRIASVQLEETILCVAFSSAPEGQSINVVAAGLSNGKIRMWNAWNLLPVRELSAQKSPMSSVISIAFTSDGQGLFASTMDGVISLWGTKPLTTNKMKAIKFITFPD